MTMTDNPFCHLAPFIQEFIYREKWEELRAIQAQAIEAVFNTSNHLLVMSGTASGKTEAVFFPIVTTLYNDPPTSIGALYIGPLKALINDQFSRLAQILQEADIPVQSWHGDIAQSKKAAFLKHGRGILQITPESLEAMLIRRTNDLSRLFGDLRFVVIDEVHAFISSDRGRQVLCQLERLEAYQTHPPRRIGLSATIGEPDLAMQWLAGRTGIEVTPIQDAGLRGEIMLGLEAFPDLPPDFEERMERAKASNETELVESLTNLEVDHLAMFEHMYQMTQRDRKTLAFSNSRSDTERTVSHLRQLAQKYRTPDIYYIHHGSISAELRQQAEAAMQEPMHPACTCATMTLELGIDIGQLDQVLQLNSPHSVSSFVQRLGRSGRRAGQASKMFFYIKDRFADTDNLSLGEQIPWSLLHAIATIQLYLEERWVEPPSIPNLPLSLLYHQTMSCLVSHTELTPAQLAERVLSLSPFKYVTLDHYRTLLWHLIETRHLQSIDRGGLIIGNEGEKIVNNYRFYATFEDDIEYQVRDNSRTIGSIQFAPNLEDRLMLAGRGWRVTQVDARKLIVYVEPVAGRAQPQWSGGGGQIHSRIIKRIQLLLCEDILPSYLHEHAKQKLIEARELSYQTNLHSSNLVQLGGNRSMLLPWEGTLIFETIVALLNYHKVSVPKIHSPFYCEIEIPGGGNPITLIRDLTDEEPSPEDLVLSLATGVLIRHKYDCYVPDTLLREAFAADNLDMSGASLILRNCT